MAAFKDITVTNNEYRACFVNGKKALFHRYEEYRGSERDLFSIPPIPTSKLLAIVEFENGTVERVDPTQIRFCDRKIREYAFPGEEVK